jgi:tyrosine-protein phosphatase YwqE
MFTSLFKTKRSLSSSELLVDIHSHLIPGIDDGARDMEESLSLLSALESMGYKKVITTPHVMIDAYDNTSKSIKDELQNLSSKAKESGINIEIEAAAEYYLDEGFLTHLHAGNILSIADKYILFETSYLSKPLQFDEILFEIATAGYTPLLAHPERYRYITDMETEYQALKERGILFQVNINSFGGHYGKEAKIKADFLNKKGMIDFLGSDVHHMKQVETLADIQKKSLYQGIFKKNMILNNTL